MGGWAIVENNKPLEWIERAPLTPVGREVVLSVTRPGPDATEVKVDFMNIGATAAVALECLAKAQANEALHLLEEGKVRGRIVLVAA